MTPEIPDECPVLCIEKGTSQVFQEVFEASRIPEANILPRLPFAEIPPSTQVKMPQSPPVDEKQIVASRSIPSEVDQSDSPDPGFSSFGRF